MEYPQLLAIVALCSIASTGSADEPAQPKPLVDFRKLAAELAHYEFKQMPSDFPRGPTGALYAYDSWLREIIRAPIREPADTPRRVHFARGDTRDAICATYSFQGSPVRFVQSQWLFVVATRVTADDVDSIHDARVLVSGVIRSIFADGDRVSLDAHEADDGGYYGRQVTPWSSEKDRWTKWNWFDTLRWWLNGDELRIMLLKSYASSAFRLYVSGLTLNRHWFKYSNKYSKD